LSAPDIIRYAINPTMFSESYQTTDFSEQSAIDPNCGMRWSSRPMRF
jgi:hypothetical protein